MAGDKTVTSKLFTAQEKTTSVNVVINAVKELLIQKKLLPGQKMPNEMEIANGLGVSRGTVREALKILSAFGIIEIKVGNGTYVAKTPQKSALDPMLFGLLLVDADTKKLSEFRKLIETDIIRLIFQYRNVNKRDIDDLINNVDELEKLCSRKEDAQIDELTFENDMEFHKIMGRASKNEMAERVYNFILDTFSYSIKISHTHQKLGEMALKEFRIQTIKSDNQDFVRVRPIARQLHFHQQVSALSSPSGHRSYASRLPTSGGRPAPFFPFPDRASGNRKPSPSIPTHRRRRQFPYPRQKKSSILRNVGRE